MPKKIEKKQAPKKNVKKEIKKENKKEVKNNKSAEKKVDNKKIKKEVAKAKKQAKKELREEIKPRHLFLKTILWLVILCLLFVIGTCLALYAYREEQNKVTIDKTTNLQSIVVSENKTIEYGVELTYKTLLNNCVDEEKLNDNIKVTIFIDGKELKENQNKMFNEVGDHTVKAVIREVNPDSKNVDFVFIPFKFEVTDMEYVVETTATYKVQDTQKPVIEGVKNKNILEGTSIDLKEGIKAKDPVDGDLGVIIEGNIDIYTPGKYTLKAKAADKNGNESEEEFTVTVMPMETSNSNKEGEVQDAPKTSKTVIPVGTKIYTVQEDDGTTRYYILPDIPGIEWLVGATQNS